MFLFDPLYLGVLLTFVLSLWAQGMVASAYNKYSKVSTGTGVPASQMVRALLNKNGCEQVSIDFSRGNGLSDHYDPRDNVMRLSQGVFSSDSIAAYGIAAHEAGHAMQYAQGYLPLKIRSSLVPIANFGSSLAVPLFLIGLIFSLPEIAMAGAWVFFFVVLFHLVTLPVELNASSRAMRALEEGGFLEREELKGARKVLNAAAMTYAAALLYSMMQWIRLMSIAGRRRR